MESVSRLVQQFVPEHYRLSLALDREGRTFTGTVEIKGTLPKKTQEIRLHAKDLTITGASIGKTIASWTLEPNDELVLTGGALVGGEQIITVAFTGKITDTMNGIYPCYYEHKGQKKELLATQFESHYAREAFPCIDEPEAKATFDVILATEPEVTVLGNMPVLAQEEKDGRLITTFGTTPRMSSYLLAWVVGDLHKKSGRTKGGVDVNVWATPAQSPKSLDFALDIATRTIDFFDTYFETPYPLPKSDHVALPDFSSGAMENWGLVTYRETALLADPALTSLSDQQYIATVIAHELSHQWFGNLVTMKWWNDLWLNESFANMMEYVAIDALEPDWHIWLSHATSDVPSALRRDALAGIQAIRCDVHHPDEIQTLFDPSIVYAKGGRLLRMLQTYLGDEALRIGLSDYFRLYAYQNTEADDLWECLSRASGKDIRTFMNTWITQPGYPLVHASEEAGQVSLRQERFFIGTHEADSARWPIPLNATCSEMPEVLETAELTVQRTHQTPLQLNKGATAHFITHYDSALSEKIYASLSTFEPIDRLSLLQEHTLLAQAGIISSADLIPLLESYKDETNDAVWDMISITINDLKKFVETDSEAEAALKRLVQHLALPQFARLSWDTLKDESEGDTKLRHTIISLLLYSEEEGVVAEARDRYAKQPLEKLDAELRSSIIASVVKQSPETVVDELLEAYRTTAHSGLRDDIAAGLTAARDEATIRRLTLLLKDTSFIRPQDFYHWYIWLLRNRYGRNHLWQWLQNEWAWIEATFSSDSHFDMIPRYVSSALATRQQLDEFRTFFSPLREHRALTRNIDIGLTEIESRVALLERDSEAVRHALLNLP